MQRGGKGALIQENKSGTLATNNDQYLFQPAIYDARGNGDGDISPTITGDHQNRITDYTAICLQGNCVDRPDTAICNGKGWKEDKSYSLNTVDQPAVMAMDHGQTNAEILEDMCPTLNCNHEQPIVSVDRRHSQDNSDATPASQVQNSGEDGLNDLPGVHSGYVVRRLTPLECERLQGYPDYYTDIGAWTDSKGKLHKESSDTARYKALGNSIALPPWRWLLQRMKPYLSSDPTMSSLFDGLAGFPLIWEDIYGKGSCLWASEVEDYCVAVSNKRINNQ